MFRGIQVSLAVHCQVQLGLNSLNSHHSKTHRDEVKQSVGAVFVFCAINGSICLQLQVVTLSAVQFGNYTLKLRLCEENDGLDQLLSCAQAVEKTPNSELYFHLQLLVDKIKLHF